MENPPADCLISGLLQKRQRRKRTPLYSRQSKAGRVATQGVANKHQIREMKDVPADEP
jgi:hypothetical protein